jgi:hypothetical protein
MVMYAKSFTNVFMMWYITTHRNLPFPFHLSLKESEYDCLRSRKLRLTTMGDLLHSPRDTPLSAKVGTKFHRQVVVAKSV